MEALILKPSNFKTIHNKIPMLSLAKLERTYDDAEYEARVKYIITDFHSGNGKDIWPYVFVTDEYLAQYCRFTEEEDQTKFCPVQKIA